MSISQEIKKIYAGAEWCDHNDLGNLAYCFDGIASTLLPLTNNKKIIKISGIGDIAGGIAKGVGDVGGLIGGVPGGVIRGLGEGGAAFLKGEGLGSAVMEGAEGFGLGTFPAKVQLALHGIEIAFNTLIGYLEKESNPMALKIITSLKNWLPKLAAALGILNTIKGNKYKEEKSIPQNQDQPVTSEPNKMDKAKGMMADLAKEYIGTQMGMPAAPALASNKKQYKIAGKNTDMIIMPIAFPVRIDNIDSFKVDYGILPRGLFKFAQQGTLDFGDEPYRPQSPTDAMGNILRNTSGEQVRQNVLEKSPIDPNRRPNSIIGDAVNTTTNVNFAKNAFESLKSKFDQFFRGIPAPQEGANPREVGVMLRKAAQKAMQIARDPKFKAVAGAAIGYVLNRYVNEWADAAGFINNPWKMGLLKAATYGTAMAVGGVGTGTGPWGAISAIGGGLAADVGKAYHDLHGINKNKQQTDLETAKMWDQYLAKKRLKEQQVQQPYNPQPAM